MQDDHESGACFQCKMIMKSARTGGGVRILQVNANHDAGNRKQERSGAGQFSFVQRRMEL
jgi:hypothetical protein